MKKMIAIALSISAAVGAVAVTAPASAAQGCGGGLHRGPAGRCIRNGGPAMRNRWVVGRHYPGRGYYYNNRWYQQRYRYHNGWRYR
jgi:hypothetical protein